MTGPAGPQDTEDDMDIKTASPAEIDAQLARIGTEMATQYRIIDKARSAIDMERKYTAPDGSVNQRRIDHCQILIDAAGVNLERLMVERSPLEGEFERRGGWTRYYLVDNDNGHVHCDASNRRCSRTPSTTHIWLVDQSGREAPDVVEDAGCRACTVCFPWAPLETLKRPTMFYTPTELEKQDARCARELKALARQAKRITNPDGSPLRVKLGGYWETIKTERAAELKALEIQFDARWQRRAPSAEELDALNAIVEALAVKQQKDQGTVLTDLQVRLIQKCKREGVRF